MIRRLLKCKNCNSEEFRFRWDYDKEDELWLMLSHNGFGFMLEDSIITCAKCGKESLYSEEDFITTESVEM